MYLEKAVIYSLAPTKYKIFPNVKLFLINVLNSITIYHISLIAKNSAISLSLFFINGLLHLCKCFSYVVTFIACRKVVYLKMKLAFMLQKLWMLWSIYMVWV